MKWLRGLLIAALIWLLIFIEISVTMIGLKLTNQTSWIIHYIFLVPIVFFCTGLYYRTKDKTKGFFLGLYFLAVGIILDMIVTVPMFIIPQGGNYMTYFSNLYMLAGFVESVILVSVYDVIRR
ncbi:MAG: DUF5367 family protein [archaeon]